MSQPSQEDTFAEAFSQDSLGVRYKETFEARHLTWFLLLADLGDFFQDKGCHSIIYGGCGGGERESNNGYLDDLCS